MRSLNKKVEDVIELIQDYKMDVMFMAETWHDSESISISKLRSRGLVVFEKARPRLPESVNTMLTNHGGVAVAFNSMFRRMLLKLTSTASFEHLCVRISSSSKSVIGLVVYRTGAASSLFYKEFENTLGILVTYNEEVLILGDFNFHLEHSDNTDAQTFLNILRSHGFDSSTNQPTHNQGGWLDVIASRKSVNINYIDSDISDYKLLLCSCEMLKPPPIYRQLQIRRWNFLDTEKFISELKLSPFSAATSLGVDSASDLYNSILSGILDKMIPFKTVRRHERPSDPWFDRECRTSNRLKKGPEKLQIRVSECVDEIASWMGANCLKLNTEKTEVIWFSSHQNMKNIPSYSVRVLDSNIFPSKSVRNLAISMDRDLTMSTQISKTIQTCFISLR